MRTVLYSIFLLAAPVFAQSGAADVTVHVHVAASRISKNCGEVYGGSSACKPTQILDVLIAGKKYQLESETFFPKGMVALGDYQATLLEDKQRPTLEFSRVYDLTFQDGSTRRFRVIGQTE